MKRDTLNPQNASPNRTFIDCVGESFPLFLAVSLLVYLLLTMLVFGTILFGDGQTVVSAPNNDLATWGIPFATFAARELHAGHLPLWNPHIYCGVPFLANLFFYFYPPCWLFQVLPVGAAFTICIALHVCLAGWFTSLWCRYRGVSPAGSMLAGTVFMFSGAFFMHVYPGHLNVLATMTYAPLIFWVIDGILRTASLRWAAIGMGTVALQIASGFPQGFYYNALIAGLYTLIRLRHSIQPRLRICLLSLSIYVIGFLMAAIVFLPPALATSESVRGGGTTLQFAGSYSLPPENLLTLVAPTLFGNPISGDYELKWSQGDGSPPPYFGRWLLWEASLFVGAAALLLAAYGIVAGDPRLRLYSSLFLFLCLLLALGSYSPFYKIFYYAIPGFKTFRANNRFDFIATLFLAMLAGIGFDQLLKERRPTGRFVTTAGGIALFLLALGLFLRTPFQSGPGGLWAYFLHMLPSTGQTISLASSFYDLPGFIFLTASHASNQLLLAGSLLALATLFLFLTRFSPRWAYALAIMLVVELFVFAYQFCVSCPIQSPYPQAWAQAKHDPQFRVLHPTLTIGNTSMITGDNDVFGYEPFGLKRYGEFIAASQGYSLSDINFIPSIRRIPAIFQMLRCQTVYAVDNDQPIVQYLPNPLPQLLLIDNWSLKTTRHEILTAVMNPSFDPRKQIILESPPQFAPSTPLSNTTNPSPGTAQLLRSTTDELEIQADLSTPAILLITDTYSKDWHVHPLAPTSQATYHIQPANYILRAIPLSPGQHHFLLRYEPLGFKIGKWLTIISLHAYILLWIYIIRRRSHPVPVA